MEAQTTYGLTVEIIVQQESPGEGRLCLGEMCVFSERKGRRGGAREGGGLCPLHLQEAGERAGQVGSSQYLPSDPTVGV